MTDLMRAYKTFTGGPNTRSQSTGQRTPQTIGAMNLTKEQAKAAIDSGLVTTEKQVKNNAGGYVFKITPLEQCRRFVILGDAAKGSYYTTSSNMLKKNIDCFTAVIGEGKHRELIDMMVDISNRGLAPKDDTIIFALAWLSCHPQDDVRIATFSALQKVLRTPTAQFKFIFTWRLAVRKSQGLKGHGWGRGMRRAFLGIYTGKPIQQLAYHVTKYQSRDGASQRDVLRLIHPSVGGKRKRDGGDSGNLDPERNLLFAWAVNGGKLSDEMKQTFGELSGTGTLSAEWDLLPYLEAVDEGLRTTDPERAVALITKHNLVREQISTGVLKSVPVWGALLKTMPMTALLRNLGSMTNKGVFDDGELLDLAIGTLTNEDAIKKSRIHPLNVYKTINQYAQGKGDKGSLSWICVREISHALQQTFRSSFKYAPKTGKKILVALDVSGSMGWQTIPGMNMNAREASAVMSVAFQHAGDPVEFCAFTSGLMPLRGTRPGMYVDDFLKVISNLPFGRTDCAQPMLYAIERQKWDIDAFVVFTDNETWAGKTKPFEALAHYAQDSGKQDAKLVVCGMTSTEFSIADPSNPFMLDIVGLDSSVPKIVSEFIAGNI